MRPMVEIRRATNGWVVEYPGGEIPLTDGCGRAGMINHMNAEEYYFNYSEEGTSEQEKVTICIERVPR